MIYSTNLSTIKLSFCCRSGWCVACNLMATSHLCIHRWDISPTHNTIISWASGSFAPHANLPRTATHHFRSKSLYRCWESMQMALSRAATQVFSLKSVCRGKKCHSETVKSQRHRQNGPKACVATEYMVNGETFCPRHKGIAPKVCVAICLEWDGKKLYLYKFWHSYGS